MESKNSRVHQLKEWEREDKNSRKSSKFFASFFFDRHSSLLRSQFFFCLWGGLSSFYRPQKLKQQRLAYTSGERNGSERENTQSCIVAADAVTGAGH